MPPRSDDNKKKETFQLDTGNALYREHTAWQEHSSPLSPWSTFMRKMVSPTWSNWSRCLCLCFRLVHSPTKRRIGGTVTCLAQCLTWRLRYSSEKRNFPNLWEHWRGVLKSDPDFRVTLWCLGDTLRNRNQQFGTFKVPQSSDQYLIDRLPSEL